MIEKEKSYSKLFGCNIHNTIRVTPLALKIINTPEFQRLRHIKQLGLCHYVYSAATHTRFEHSIGVYHLAGQMMDKIYQLDINKEYLLTELSNEPIRLDATIMECIKIAALCHDIGHGPFSHIFDDVLLKNSTHVNRHHETRSCLITEIICRRELLNELSELSEHHINFIKSVINPQNHHQGALYQIVANNLNGIDVDKFDYLARDTRNLGIGNGNGFNSYRLINEIIIDQNNNIAYPKHCSVDVYELFYCRYMMHKKVYNHKTVKLIELMLGDLFLKIDSIFNISASIENMTNFCKLNDNTIFNYIETVINPQPYISVNLNNKQHQEIMHASKIYNKIISRKLYQLIAENADVMYEDFILKEFLQELLKKYPEYKPDFFAIIKVKFGFVSGNKSDPFDSIFFYDKKENINTFTVKKSHISGLIGNEITEKHWYLVCKKRSIYSVVMGEYRKFNNSRI